jgi:predicted nucleic acid-binding protein
VKRGMARPKPTVLIDTNILVSGLVFLKGNEHRILKLAEDKRIVLVLPEFAR